MSQPKAETDSTADDIRVLVARDIDELRLGWWSRFDSSEVKRTLEMAPGLSVWSPATSEYLLAGPWRHRADVAYIIELVAIRHSIDLVRRAIAGAREAGKRLFLAIEMSERRQPIFYERSGLCLLEEVVPYEYSGMRACQSSDPSADIRLAGALTEPALRALMDVDSDAFPWLWRNSEEEFQDYVTQPGVEIHVLREGSATIGYVGLSSYPGWGHIDRIAVKRNSQGQGYGRQLTAFAVDRLKALGATKIGLSTQHRNARSQSLYEAMGFKRQATGDYRIYGVALNTSDSIDDLVAG